MKILIRHQSEELGKLWARNEPCRDQQDKQAVNIHCLLRTWSFKIQEISYFSKGDYQIACFSYIKLQVTHKMF